MKNLTSILCLILGLGLGYSLSGLSTSPLVPKFKAGECITMINNKSSTIRAITSVGDTFYISRVVKGGLVEVASFAWVDDNYIKVDCYPTEGQ